MDSNNFGTTSLFIFLAMFGGSTFILFLLCYFCQKKLQYSENLPVTIAGNESQQRQVFIIPPTTLSNRQSLPATSPPPDYYSVVEKDVLYQPDCSDPPPYEIAVSNRHLNNFQDTLASSSHNVNIFELKNTRESSS